MLLINNSEWHKILKEYEQACKKYRFLFFGTDEEKSQWSIFTGDYIFIEISFELNKRIVVILDNNIVFTFSPNDESFGEFLFDKFFSSSDKEVMKIKGGKEEMASIADLANASYNYGCGSSATDWGVATTNVSNTADWGVATISTSYDSLFNLETRLDQLETVIYENKQKDKDKDKKKKENTNMKNIDLNFGPCKDEKIGLSMYGLSVLNSKGKWVSYNQDSEELIAVDVFNVPNGGKYMFKIPVPFKDVKVGDILIHNGSPVFVKKVNNNETFDVLDPTVGELKTIILTKNIFGFNFATKIVSIMKVFSDTPTADKPFGNMLPFLMMDEEKNVDPLTMMMLLNQNEKMDFIENPMMLMMLKDSKDIDPMMLMMLMNMKK